MQFEHKNLQLVAATRSPYNLPAGYRGEVRVGDLRDANYLDRVLTGIDVICHAAGWSNYSAQGQASRVNYLEPTIDLINRAREWRVARFVNLSSIGVAAFNRRSQDDSPGKPRRGCAMLNCMVAVEDYLKTQADRISIINLRAGIYSGQQLHLGLLPLLLQRPGLPLVAGRYGYLPIVDGDDLGQAFARAALLPDISGYVSLNIAGAESPTQKAVLEFINTNSKQKYATPAALPLALALPIYKVLSWLSYQQKNPATTCAITAMLTNPAIDTHKAQQLLGYKPLVKWQTSIENFVSDYQHRPVNPALFIDPKDLLV